MRPIKRSHVCPASPHTAFCTALAICIVTTLFAVFSTHSIVFLYRHLSHSLLFVKVLDIMASKPSPGSFLMETASIGFTIVTSILNLGASRKLKDLAAEISLSASLLSEAGREVDQNSRYFSGTFESKFKIITEKCRTEYEKVRAALEAVQSYDTPIPAIRNNVMYISDQPPSQPWKKLVWGLEKSQYDSSKVVEEIKGCSEQAWMINYVILLVVIQKHAQEWVKLQYFVSSV